MSNLNLASNRHFAALSSWGISNDIIYQKFLQIVNEFNLKGDLLHFGAGAGKLTQLIHELGRFGSITSADIMQQPVSLDKSVRWISEDLNNPLNIADETFDVIVSPEVIEHLENPRAVVREWLRLLRPGGTLIFSTPNNESWRSLFSLIVQGHFVAFVDTCYPAHITPMVRKDIERILNESGFSKPKFVFTDVGGIPKFPTYKWQSISWGLLKGLRFSDNLIVVCHKNK
jgi:2-polyprenyl-3-methyl-5-hydroxy-6-metoxy-1,4-benzoquinol methylase